MKIKVGILFGGPSRERELSFLEGRTVYHTMDRSLFEPVPIFVDSTLNYILLEDQWLEQSSIRDFYPVPEVRPASPHNFRVYQESLTQLTELEAAVLMQKAGKKIELEDLPKLISVAYLALPGEFGISQIQEQLEKLRIPYTGCKAEVARIVLDKQEQSARLEAAGFQTPKRVFLTVEEWKNADVAAFKQQIKEQLGFPVYIGAENAAFESGLRLLDEEAGLEAFEETIDQAFFRERIPLQSWSKKGDFDRVDHIQLLTDLEEGLGFPIRAQLGDEQATLDHPDALLKYLNRQAAESENPEAVVVLESQLEGHRVIIQAQVPGKTFSCSVLQLGERELLVLPPTEMVSRRTIHDIAPDDLSVYSAKELPVKLPLLQIEAIRMDCKKIFQTLGLQVLSQVDGTVQDDGQVVYQAIHVHGGVLPNAALFQQATAVGIPPAGLLTTLIGTSLNARTAEHSEEATYRILAEELDQAIQQQKERENSKTVAGILFGGEGPTLERSLESTRHLYTTLTALEKYQVRLYYFLRKAGGYQLYQVPGAFILRDWPEGGATSPDTFVWHPLVQEIRTQNQDFLEYLLPYLEPVEPTAIPVAELANAIAVACITTADPGLRKALEKASVPLVGADAKSCQILLDRFHTAEILATNGFQIPDQLLVSKTSYQEDQDSFIREAEAQFGFPVLAEAVDDLYHETGRLLHTEEELAAYARLLFRPRDAEGLEARKALKLGRKTYFPQRDKFILEKPLVKDTAGQLYFVRAYVQTQLNASGQTVYQVYPLAGVEIPKEGYHTYRETAAEITFSTLRFSLDSKRNQQITERIQTEIEKAARVLNIHGMTSVEGIVHVEAGEVRVKINQCNPVPKLHDRAGIYQQARKIGMAPADLIDQLFSYPLAFNIWQEKRKKEAAESTETVHSKLRTGPMIDYTKPSVFEESSSAETGKEEQPAGFFKNLITFLKSPIFLKNLAGILGSTIILILLATWMLRSYTHHGESYTVGDYIGQDLAEARRLARGQTFRIVVSDSIFIVGEVPNKVFDQDPKPGAQVKKRRNIYLTVTGGTAPEVLMPSLIGKDDFDQYKRELERRDVKLLIRERRFDRDYQENTILEFYHRGKRITPRDVEDGYKIPKGSTLEAVVSIRNTGQVQIPNLVCNRFSTARFTLSSNKLEVGEVSGTQNNSAFVWKQEPAYEPGKQIPQGTPIKLYLQAERPEGCD